MTKEMIKTLYQDTLLKLNKGIRPQIRLTPLLINDLKLAWTESLLEVLCILGHCQNSSAEFNFLLLEALNLEQDPKTVVFLLAATEKHLIADALKSGNMPPAEFLIILKKLLQSKNPEILEWTLRTIEAMGPLNNRLKNEVRASRPGIKKIFNVHLKASDEIINLLEEQWKQN